MIDFCTFKTCVARLSVGVGGAIGLYGVSVGIAGEGLVFEVPWARFTEWYVRTINF